MLRRASARGFTLWAVTPAEEAEIHSGLFAGLENGTLRPVVGKELPLAEAARAHKQVLEPELPEKSFSCPSSTAGPAFRSGIVDLAALVI